MRLQKRVGALEERGAPETKHIILYPGDPEPTDLGPNDNVIRVVYVTAEPRDE